MPCWAATPNSPNPVPTGSRPRRSREPRSINRRTRPMAKDTPTKPGLLRLMVRGLRTVPLKERMLVMFGVWFSGLFELFGFATIIPLLSVLSPESGHVGGRRGVIRDALEGMYHSLGLPMDMTTLLLTIMLFLVIKAVVSIGVSRYVASVMTRVNTRARLEVIHTLMHARWSFYARQRLSRLVSAAGEASN